MAQRFGGKYSPDGSPNNAPDAPQPFKDAKPRKAGARVNLLFIAPAPLLGTIWGASTVEFGLTAAGGAALLLAAWLTREGVFAQEAYDARTVARRPAIPRKLFGAALIGIGLTLVALTDSGVLGVIPALVGVALHVFAFGPDPMKDKGFDGVDAFQQNRVATLVEEAEKSLTIMEATAEDLGDRAMERRIDDFTTTARNLFRRVEEDPQDLTAARKFMSVYLTGAKDATQKFAALYKRKRDPKIRADFETFLDDLEGNFVAKTGTLLENNKVDLEIEMKVLRDRLAREGLVQEK